MRPRVVIVGGGVGGRRQANVPVWLADVPRIDVARKVVVLAENSGEAACDHLIVAAGVTHSYFGHDDWRPHAPGLKTLDDALDIRTKVLGPFELADHDAPPPNTR